jgi:hypothetical protein
MTGNRSGMNGKSLTKKQLESQSERFNIVALSQVDQRIIKVLDSIPFWIIQIYVGVRETENLKKALKNKRKKV